MPGLMNFLGDYLWVVKVEERVELHRADDPPVHGQVLEQLSSYLTDAELEWRRPPEPLMNELFGEGKWLDVRVSEKERAAMQEPEVEWEDREKDYTVLDCGCTAGLGCTCE